MVSNGRIDTSEGQEIIQLKAIDKNRICDILNKQRRRKQSNRGREKRENILLREKKM